MLGVHADLDAGIHNRIEVIHPNKTRFAKLFHGLHDFRELSSSCCVSFKSNGIIGSATLRIVCEPVACFGFEHFRVLW